MRVLFLSNLFPDSDRPAFGLHNAGLIRRLARHHAVSVVAPRPGLRAFLSRPGRAAAMPCDEDRGLSARFPAVPYVPRVGSLVNHRLYAAWLAPVLARECEARRPEVVLAAWAYPDACAALRLAVPAGLPCVVIAQGSDINDYLDYPVRRRVILGHLARASAVVTRSEALRERLLAAGLPGTKVRTIYNGVDTELFHPALDREALRTELGLPTGDPVVLFVGNLVPVKNPLLAVEAVARLVQRPGAPRWRLLVVGDGAQRAAVQAAAAAALGDAATLVGTCAQEAVSRYMQAADVLCVPSRNEGVPNVIREALACGLPVVATRVGGIPEVMSEPLCGELVDRDRPDAMAAALDRVVRQGPWCEACRRHALNFSWDETVRRYDQVLAEVAGQAVAEVIPLH